MTTSDYRMTSHIPNVLVSSKLLASYLAVKPTLAVVKGNGDGVAAWLLTGSQLLLPFPFVLSVWSITATYRRTTIRTGA